MSRLPARPVHGHEAGLDGLRGVAALMVFLYHLRWISGQPNLTFAGINWELVLRRFDSGVCLFFVLSGYLLSRSFWDGVNTDKWPDISRYLIRRAARIIPAYWFLLFTVNAISAGSYNAWSALGVTLQLSGLHTFAEYVYKGCVPVLWSIGIEWQFYFLLPSLFYVSCCVAQKRKWMIPVVMSLAAIAVDTIWRAGIAPFVLGRVPDKFLSSLQSPVVQQSCFYFLKWFGVGIAGAWLVRRYPLIEASPLFARTVFILGIVMSILTVCFSAEGEWRTISIWGWPLNSIACLLIVISVPHVKAIGLILANTIARYVGAISYGIYLWHWPVQKAVFGGTLPGRLGPVGGFFIGGLISLLVTCIIAAMSYIVLERPVIAWARRQGNIHGAMSTLLVHRRPSCLHAAPTGTSSDPIGLASAVEGTFSTTASYD